MSLRDYTKRDCDNIDAAIFSGDEFMSLKAIKELEHYMARWQRELNRNRKAIAGQEKDKT